MMVNQEVGVLAGAVPTSQCWSCCCPCSHGDWCSWLHVLHPTVLGDCWHPKAPGHMGLFMGSWISCWHWVGSRAGTCQVFADHPAVSAEPWQPQYPPAQIDPAPA